LTVKNSRDGLECVGSFGVFYPGRLQLAWEDNSGKTISIEPLDVVSPFEIIRLKQTLQPPSRAVRLELRVIANADDSQHSLAKCQF